jgi:hypothetical protein
MAKSMIFASFITIRLYDLVLMSKYLFSLLRLTFICFVFAACNKKSDVDPDSDSLIYITSENKLTTPLHEVSVIH